MRKTEALVIGICIIVAAVVLGIILRSSSDEVGRYQISRSSGVNVFVLDTKTGKLWSRFVSSDSGSTNWALDAGPWTEKK